MDGASSLCRVHEQVKEQHVSRYRGGVSDEVSLNIHVLSHLLLINICKLHWNLNTLLIYI